MLRFSGAACKNPDPDGKAIELFRATLKGDLYFDNKFEAMGGVWLSGTKIAGTLSFRDGTFNAVDPKSDRVERRIAICATGVSVGDKLDLRQIKVMGWLDLSGAKTTNLEDDKEVPTDAELVLDGFTYKRLYGDSPTDAKTRESWLDRQIQSHLGKDFRPQPWVQLHSVLRAMGYMDEAREIAIAQQVHRRRPETGKIKKWPARFLHWIYGASASYGYRPGKAFSIFLGVWLVSTIFFWYGYENGVIAPKNRDIAQEIDGNNQIWDKGEKRWRPFVPYMYALDLLIPLVNLQQRDDWAPIVRDAKSPFDARPLGWFMRFWMWVDIVFGCAAGVLIGAIVSTAIRKT